MSVDSIKNTIIVALGVCLVSSILVSATVVSLKPLQEKNKKLDKLKNILEAGDLYSEGADVEKVYNSRILPQVINLKSGKVLNPDKLEPELKPENFDLKKIAKDSRFSSALDPAMDEAKIKRRPDYMVTFGVTKDGQISKYILPIYCSGLWSTLYGFIAIDKNLNNVDGFTFYEHGETPGLGGEVDNPKWKAQWVGKMLYDQNGNLKIQVIKGTVDPANPDSKYEISGLSGATLTTRGVNNLVRFWLDKNGYGPFLDQLRKEVSAND